ncbi:unnamed protein product [Protopolystoma xenopodis]|uniref:Protein kinase domain-containing protein n=1 Tax=Protopolystoma xenopodis TaxID=117903 RepID=A0A3S5CEX1_9PLAT|nr:unnamed protein product [Protopolystoma xenopodis]
MSPAVDIFACGLLAYYILSGGGHAFDEPPCQTSVPNHAETDFNQSSMTLSTTNTNEDESHARNNDLYRHFATEASLCRLSVGLQHHRRQAAIADGHLPSLTLLPDMQLATTAPLSVDYKGRPEVWHL